MLDVIRGQVDNESNNQSHLNILNNIQSESLIYESESIAIRNRNIGVQESEHSKAMSTVRRTQECDVRIGTGTGMGTGTIL